MAKKIPEADTVVTPIKENETIQVRIEPPASYTYSNIAGVAVTPWDIRINFADVHDGNSGKAEEQRQAPTLAGIAMPPEHAAGLALLLIEQLRAFEKSFGAVRHAKWSQKWSEL